jgi:hypothetical protein
MAQVITFENYLPAARYDATPWTEADIEEGETAAGPWVLLETIALSPVDADPADPAYRDFTTELASDDPELWYRIVFRDATGDESQATAAIQNVASSDFTAYTSVIELARILKISTPSDEQTTAMERVLLAAAGEINAEIDLAEDVSLSGWQLALAAQVNLQRAEELWHLQEVPMGLAGLGSEFGATHLARNSWDKHAYTLAPLKNQWGLA